MSSTTKTPDYETTVETEATVIITAGELEAAGWVYAGVDDVPPPEHVIEVVRRWHDAEHGDAWKWCGHPLCSQLNRPRPTAWGA